MGVPRVLSVVFSRAGDVFHGITSPNSKILLALFPLQNRREWNRKYRTLGVRNHLVRGCPRQMSRCGEVAIGRAHPKHNQICFGLGGLLQNPLGRRTQLDYRFWRTP